MYSVTSHHHHLLVLNVHDPFRKRYTQIIITKNVLIAEYNVINRNVTDTVIENIRRIRFCSLDIGLTLLRAKIEVLRLENNPNMFNVVREFLQYC